MTQAAKINHFRDILTDTLNRINNRYGKGDLEVRLANEWPPTKGLVMQQRTYGLHRYRFDIFQNGVKGWKVKFLGKIRCIKAT